MPASVSRPKRLLITGGRGRLAPLIADHFRAPTHETVLYTRGGGPGLRELNRLLRPDELAAGDVLLHLAWSTLPATAEQSPGLEQKHDLPWLESLLRAIAARPAAARPHLIFFSSGGTVYGNAPGRPNRETDECRPIGRYGQAKLAAEKLIAAAIAQHGLPGTILRISNPYGYPVPSGRLQGIIPHAISAAVQGRPLTIWGDGSARKDFIYHTDFLSALQAVIDRQLTGVFNICAGESHTVSEILARAGRHTGRTISTTTAPAPAWDVQDSRLDHGRFAEATGWRPQVPLDEGIRRAAAGYLDR